MPDGLDKQVPRPPNSPSKTARIQVQNRRREYLQRQPSYFTGLDHELADPVLYQRLVKQHQTAEERQSEGKRKGYGRVLEADLARGETRLSAMATEAAGEKRTNDDTPRWQAPSGLDNPWDGDATTKTEGIVLWNEFLTERFIQGGDDDFDYTLVDGNEDYDAVARRDAEDKWFDEEEPSDNGVDTGVQDF